MTPRCRQISVGMLRRGLGTAAAAARSLSGRVALVTGSASGIGLGVAKVLASRGADVVLHGLAPRAELDKLERDIADMHGVRVVASDANLMNGAEAAVELRDLSLSKMGKHIDILVNNAGIQVRSTHHYWTKYMLRHRSTTLSTSCSTYRRSNPSMRMPLTG